MKKTLFIISEVLIFVSALIYSVLAACFYSLSMPIYWLFIALGLIALFDGLAISTTRNKEVKKALRIVMLALSFVSPISLAINLIIYFKFKEGSIDFAKAIEQDQPKKRIIARPMFYITIASLLSIFVSSLIAQSVNTTNFSVDVSDFTLTKENFNQYGEQPINGVTQSITDKNASWSVTMYKPKTATEAKKAPVVFVMPGFTRTKATMAQYAIEYSRRGSVAFIIDPGCQGATTAAGYNDDTMIPSTEGANGLEYLIHYVYKNTERFNFIDRNRIGTIGHSAGGGNVVTAASDYAGSNYSESVIKALYISGYIKSSAANKYASLHCNAVNAYAYYDEGIYRYQTASTSLEVINLRFVNEVSGDPKNIELNNLKYDYAYGDMENGTYRMLHREKTNHAFQMYDQVSITNTIAFFNEALNFNTELANDSQVWFAKEFFNGFALVNAFIFVIGLVSLLLEYVPFLRPKTKLETNENKEVEQDNNQVTLVPKKGSFASKAIFYGSMVLSAVIACLDFIPLARLSMDLFPEAASNTYTYFFPARMMNAILLWAVVNGLIGLVIYFGTTLIENLVELIGSKIQKRKANYDWSKFDIVKVHWKDLLISLVTPIVMFFLFYGLVALMYTIFHQDFRFMLISAAPLQPRYIVTWLMYVPLFFIFYISNSIRVNGSIAREGLKEWQVYLVSGIANSIGLVFILIINYTKFFTMGEVFYGYWGNPGNEVWLYINMVFALIPLMFILPLLNRYFYKKSKNVYLGAILVCMLFIMMSLSASVSYIPM